MLLYWQINTEPKRGKQNFVYPRRRAPHVESLVAATLQQSAQRPIFNTEEYRQKLIKSHISTTQRVEKKPEGCAEGPWLYGPFAVFLIFPKQEPHASCQGKQNIHHTIKTKIKNRNKGEKA